MYMFLYVILQQNKFSMRARAWEGPEFDFDELKPRETPKIAARLMRTELPRIGSEMVKF